MRSSSLLLRGDGIEPLVQLGGIDAEDTATVADAKGRKLPVIYERRTVFSVRLNRAATSAMVRRCSFRTRVDMTPLSATAMRRSLQAPTVEVKTTASAS